MNEARGVEAQRIKRWPFLVADLLLILVAVITYAHGQHWPFGPTVGLAPWTGWVLTVCVFLGAAFSVMPYLLEHRQWAKMAQIDRVQTAMQQVRNIEQAARQIHSATASWQAVQDDASKAVAAAKETQEQMTAEVRSFQDFLQRANDSERTHLRLEVDKLRRAEGEWLQVLVRVLDHVWALYQAAVKSGKINLVEQLSHFQRACRDAAQRVGLVPFTAHNGDSLDPELHQLANPDDQQRTQVPIAETVATGYRYQGQIVRKAVVLLLPPEPAEKSPALPAAEAFPESEAEPQPWPPSGPEPEPRPEPQPWPSPEPEPEPQPWPPPGPEPEPRPEPQPWPSPAPEPEPEPQPEPWPEPTADDTPARRLEAESSGEWREANDAQEGVVGVESEPGEPAGPDERPVSVAAEGATAAREEKTDAEKERPMEMEFWPRERGSEVAGAPAPEERDAGREPQDRRGD